MNIRIFQEDDIKPLNNLIKNHYDKEFTIDDILSPHIVQLFTVEDGEIFSIGGIRNILEIVLVGNKSIPLRDRREAGYHILRASAYTAERLGYQGLHSYVQDEKFLKHLIKMGFRETKGKSLVLSLGDNNG